ncbi:hypothetical protein KUTeg_003074 [Tegillarca granosa]|uniref:G-protein coupled receptors family 1 profile domain-containing protein n=1 Tax=Tegillarca granosa TaxID=220873 RepID=A0ABQ9FQJ9_TEGGR|nr:hypothetical protein KUTeg_003074 [Tegillarca granosa]
MFLQSETKLTRFRKTIESIFLCKVANACPIWCITCSIYTLVVISFERKRGIVYSLSKQISIEHCKIIIPSLWIASTLVIMPTIIAFGEVNVFDENHNKTYTSCGTHLVTHTYSFVNGIFLLLCSYIIPLFILLFNYFEIIRFVLKQGKEVKPSENQTNGSLVTSTSVVFKKRIQIVKMLIIVAVLFAVSWLPYFITLIIAKVSGKDASEHASGPENMMKIFLSAFSTAYNVVLYVIFNANFRRGLKEILCCRASAPSRSDNQNKDGSVVPSGSRKTQNIS